MLYSYSHVDMIRYSYLYLTCIGCKQRKLKNNPNLNLYLNLNLFLNLNPFLKRIKEYCVYRLD